MSEEPRSYHCLLIRRAVAASPAAHGFARSPLFDHQLDTQRAVVRRMAFADGVISRIAAWRKHIARIEKRLDFFAVVLAGNCTEIVQAAVELNAELEAG